MVVTEVYRLAAESRTSYLFYDAPDSPVPDITFQLSWQTVSAQVKNLLSNPTYLAFKRMEEIIASPPLFSTQDITDRLPRLRNLDQVRDAPLQAFHKEISILQGETKSNHMTLVHVNCRGLNPTGLSEGSTVPILCGLI
jgi:hypothetical protein